ncbi:MAG: anti-sigma factor [Jatrophihabitantaceae bacterium]
MTDELTGLVGAYALDALDDDEREVFEQHLQTCAECAEEVRGLRYAAAELSHLGEVSPPPQLRAAVLSAVAQSRPLPPRVDGARGSNVVPLRRDRTKSLWQGLAAACALIAIAVSGWGWAEHRDAQRAVSPQASAVQRLLNAPDVKAATTTMKQGQGILIYSKSEHQLVLVGHGMPTLPSDKTYQLWMMNESGDPVSGGLFRTDQAGNVEVPASGDLDRVTQMAVSVEPAGGSATPTPETVQLLNL